jgi:hypothetical protein
MNALIEPRPAIVSPLAALRDLLNEKFPAVEVRPSGILPTGLADLDRIAGGLPQGVVTELVGPTSGGALFVETMLNVLVRQRCFGALVEVGNSYNPEDSNPSALRRLLWVRSPSVVTAVKAVDLLLRDGNLRVLLLDLQTVSARELRSIPASTWHRFQRLVEVSNMALIVLNSQPVVEAAKVRIAIPRRWTLQAMRERRRHLLQRLSPQVFERRQFPNWDARQKSA